MDELQVIAVEIPYLVSYRSADRVNACVVRDKSLFLYTIFKELVPLGKYSHNINHLVYAIKEGRYDWVDFTIENGQTVWRSYDNDILLDDEQIVSFRKLSREPSKISEASLRQFNDFLKISNRHSSEMQSSLNQAYNEGIFRAEIEEIVNQDMVRHLAPLDKEIVVRSKQEGLSFLKSYVDQLLIADRSDKYLEINYFFRRVFDLEVNNYISFENQGR
ncbi:MAG TPA: hypothetical protein VHS59_04785 [Bacillota bacterium]|nr:hypothetical protein [Bacillota bacterium]